MRIISKLLVPAAVAALAVLLLAGCFGFGRLVVMKHANRPVKPRLSFKAFSV